MVANLRLVVGQYPEDTRLASLIGELSMKSDAFATMWADHRVRLCDVAEYEMRHPLVGPLTLTQQALRLADDQVVVVATAPAGSASRSALRLLAQATAGSRAPGCSQG